MDGRMGETQARKGLAYGGTEELESRLYQSSSHVIELLVAEHQTHNTYNPI